MLRIAKTENITTNMSVAEIAWNLVCMANTQSAANKIHIVIVFALEMFCFTSSSSFSNLPSKQIATAIGRYTIISLELSMKKKCRRAKSGQYYYSKMIPTQRFDFFRVLLFHNTFSFI